MLQHGLVMYDALYAWCQSCQQRPTTGRRSSAAERDLNAHRPLAHWRAQAAATPGVKQCNTTSNPVLPPWTLNGISPRLIESHYENNYGGALRRLNSLTEQLESLDVGTTSPHVIGQMKRDQSPTAELDPAARAVLREHGW